MAKKAKARIGFKIAVDLLRDIAHNPKTPAKVKMEAVHLLLDLLELKKSPTVEQPPPKKPKLNLIDA